MLGDSREKVLLLGHVYKILHYPGLLGYLQRLLDRVGLDSIGFDANQFSPSVPRRLGAAQSTL